MLPFFVSFPAVPGPVVAAAPQLVVPLTVVPTSTQSFFSAATLPPPKHSLSSQYPSQVGRVCRSLCFLHVPVFFFFSCLVSANAWEGQKQMWQPSVAWASALLCLSTRSDSHFSQTVVVWLLVPAATCCGKGRDADGRLWTALGGGLCDNDGQN